MIRIDRNYFSELIEEAWNNLPDEWQEKLADANISYQVMNFATPEILQKMNISNSMSLLGLYTGTPITVRPSFSPYSWPDRILLFQIPIQSRARDLDHLKEIIAHVLYHEIGHYFGMDEDQLHEAQKDNNPL
ncbi:MAG: metallopeptidase family protein [Caldisericia bacterium]